MRQWPNFAVVSPFSATVSLFCDSVDRALDRAPSLQYAVACNYLVNRYFVVAKAHKSKIWRVLLCCLVVQLHGLHHRCLIFPLNSANRQILYTDYIINNAIFVQCYAQSPRRCHCHCQCSLSWIAQSVVETAGKRCAAEGISGDIPWVRKRYPWVPLHKGCSEIFTASEMTYTVSGGALNFTQSNPIRDLRRIL